MERQWLLLIVVVSLTIIDSFVLHPVSLQSKLQQQQFQHWRRYSSSPSIIPSEDFDEWWKPRGSEDEEVIFKVTDVSSRLPEGYSFLDVNDAITGRETFDGPSDKFFISDLTLREISEAYQFSLSYLGDYVVQLGCQPPIDVDTKVSNLLLGEQIYSLLEAINSLDPAESHCEYDSLTIGELADELDISMGKMMKICQNEKVNLPFGLETTLHTSVVERIREVQTYDEYVDEDEDDEDEDGERDEFGDRTGSAYSLNS
jgi:hypothetical protein